MKLAFLTGLAGFFYTVACWPALITPTALGALTVRLATIVFIAWYSYALSSVLHSEKRGNDQLLRHLTEGALVFDANDRVLLVNTYHHIEERADYFRALRESLKPGAQVAIIDYRVDAPRGAPKHMRMPPEKKDQG